jgi:glycosyltransferase involved in cell wall biosynthesis
MRDETTVTIGIPAFNEEANIASLLNAIMNQKEESFVIERIIVANDASSDSTYSKVKKMKSVDDRISIIRGCKRLGKTKRLNQIYRKATSDVLVTLDADIVIKDGQFIKNLILPIMEKDADLVSNRLEPLAPTNFIEKVLYVSISFKNDMEELNGGDNLYSCHGTSRAFSKKLYSKFQPPNIVSEDAYSYLFAKKMGFKYYYTNKAVTYFKLPDNVSDHSKQSVRFFRGQGELGKHFDKDFVKEHHKIPVILLLNLILKYTVKHPGEVFTYIFFVASMRVKSVFSSSQSVRWSVAESTRRINS